MRITIISRYTAIVYYVHIVDARTLLTNILNKQLLFTGPVKNRYE